MDLAQLVQKHQKNKPPRIILHGPHGIGKTTFGSNAPNPIFLITEDGLTNIDVDHFPPCQNLENVKTYLNALLDNEHEYKTLIIDTIDWLERIFWQDICDDKKVDSIEEIGYGRGYSYALKHWERLFKKLDVIRSKGMAILLLAHNEIKTYNPPDNTPYDRYQIKLHKSASALAEEWADAVLFANYKVFVNKDKDTLSRGKAVGSERVIKTSPNPAYRAKNRYGLPDEIPMDFGEILKYIKNNRKQVKES